jgi:hypothetical protein
MKSGLFVLLSSFGIWSLNPRRIAATTVSMPEQIRWGPSRQDSDTEHVVLDLMTHKLNLLSIRLCII